MKYKEGDRVVCISLDRENKRIKSKIKLHGVYTVNCDFGEEDNPNVTFNMLENIISLKETDNLHNRKDFISLTEFRKQKISNILED